MKKDLLLKGGKLTRVQTEDDTPGNSPYSTGTPPARPLGAEGQPSESVGFAPLSPLSEVFTDLSERQFLFLSWRLGCASDEEAADQADIPLLDILSWRSDPEFESVYQRVSDNKREAFKVLGTHLLPKALRVIDKMLESDSIRANTAGLQYLLKTQALLDQPAVDQSEQVGKLLDALRIRQAIEPLALAPRD